MKKVRRARKPNSRNFMENFLRKRESEINFPFAISQVFVKFFPSNKT